IATSPRLIEMVAALSSKSSHRSPRSSFRRMPVNAATHRAAKNRWPAAARRKARSSSAVQERCSILGMGPQAWGVGDEGDVAGDEPAPDGVAERAADDQVDLVDRLGREGG